ASAVVIAVPVRLVPDLPVLDADGGRVADAKEVVAVVGRHLPGRAQRGPVADGLPVVARAVLADHDGAGGIAVGVGDPGGRLLRDARAGSRRVHAVVD